MPNITFVIAMPRFALSGGNLVSYHLGLNLQSKGYSVICDSGFNVKKIDEVRLLKSKKGFFGTVLNLLSFLLLSFHAIFYDNFISTHHLTSVFNFIRRCKFCFVQDIESEFYPKSLKWLGNYFWNNYLRAENIIFTNKILAKKLGYETGDIGFPYVDIPIVENHEKKYDAILILRDGDYKNPVKTYEIFNNIKNFGGKVILINASKRMIEEKGVMNNLNRNDFIKMLNMSNCFICLSDWEGLGLPNLEAYALGLKIISTSIPSAILLKEFDNKGVSIFNGVIDSEMIRGNLNEIDVKNRASFLKHESEKWFKYACEKITRASGN
ncbi:glycosyltransferase [Pectobacterium carotovorum]|uniref:glycosyltransferase n=1 Tax=Pectobacterium carotovorum TaxID=554 RepID=UPI002A837FB4|nr:glycosyltransferase [Pectobacterium carotovorum]MDY4376086.1 glycosyltransferase [Pectobacterium carotovorum subsp. carotovorum]